MGGLLRSLVGWITAGHGDDRPAGDPDDERRSFNRAQAIDNRSRLGWWVEDQFLSQFGRVVDVSLSGIQLQLEHLPEQVITTVVFKVDQPDQSHWVEASIAWRGETEDGQLPRIGLKFHEFLPYQVYNTLSTGTRVVAFSLDHISSLQEDLDAPLVKPSNDSERSGDSRSVEGQSAHDSAHGSQHRWPSALAAIGGREPASDRAKQEPNRRNSGRYPAVENTAALGWWLGDSFREVQGRFLDMNHLGTQLEIDGTLPPYIEQLWVRLITPRRTIWISVREARREMLPDCRMILGLRFERMFEYDLFKYVLGYLVDDEQPSSVCPEFDGRYWR